VVTSPMGDCVRIGKPSWYETNTKVNSAFYPSMVGKSNTSVSGWADHVHLCWVEGNAV